MAAQSTVEMTRIYVGGLGERVTEEDLRKTFSNVGSIGSIEFIKSKGRNFAYINFYPSSDKSLAKLFSTYNGCMWKGGKLKLEKAREHYMNRLKREWEEDAKALNVPHNDHAVNEDTVASPKQKSSLDFDKTQIRIFFPKLRKVKSLDLRGTGKHKYSFQRVEAPSHPLRFCDCPEHSVPVKTQEKIVHISMMKRGFDRHSCPEGEKLEFPVREQLQDSKIQDGGMDEEEISIMNSVMKKLLDRETSKIEQQGCQDLPQQRAPASGFPVDTNEVEDGTDDDDDDEDDDDDIKINVMSGQNRGSISESWDLQTSLVNEDASASSFPVDTNEVEDGTDDDDYDDDIKINVMSGQNNGSISESWDLQTSLVSEMARPNEQRRCDDSTTPSNSQIQERNDKLFARKRKSPVDENDEMKWASPMSKKKAGLQSNKSENHIEDLNIVTEAGTKESNTQKEGWSQKSAVGDGLTNSFSLTDNTPSNETSSDSEGHEGVDNAVNENSDGESTQNSEKDEVVAAQPDEPKTNPDKSIRGSSWLQKSSWTQLIGGGNSSSFSISQILPASMLEKRDQQNQNASSTMHGESSRAKMKEPTRSKPGFGNPRVASKGFGLSKAASDAADVSNKTIINKKSDSKQKQTLSSSSSAYPGAGVGDSCPFMRSADSLKDWMSAKTALSGALKRRNNKA